MPQAFLSNFIDRAADATDDALERAQELQSEKLPAALDCMTEQGRGAGEEAGHADFLAGLVDPSPTAGPEAFSRARDTCGVPEAVDTGAYPPVPTTPLQAFVTGVLFPTQLNSGEQEHFQAASAFGNGYREGYREQGLNDFDSRMATLLAVDTTRPSPDEDDCDSWVTESGQVVPALTTDPKVDVPDECVAQALAKDASLHEQSGGGAVSSNVGSSSNGSSSKEDDSAE
jgi:hypothetical protein